jgi:3-dehydrosphinganine reductase
MAAVAITPYQRHAGPRTLANRTMYHIPACSRVTVYVFFLQHGVATFKPLYTVFAKFIMWWSSNQLAPRGKTALIVGGSQGIGVDLGLQLYERQCSVVLVARTAHKLEAQVARIRKQVPQSDASVTILYITCDAADYNACAELWHTLHMRQQDPDLIFCCAGLLVPKLFNELTPHDLQTGIDLNYHTALNMAHTAFKHALKHSDADHSAWKPRHIILFLSVVSFFPFIGYAQYGPMKAAVQLLSLILRQELCNYNYRVSCIFPGNFQSEGYDEEHRTKPEITKQIEGPSKPVSTAHAARLVLRRLDQGYDTVTTDFIGWILGCSVLGILPRTWGLLQVLVALVFSIVEPLAMWVVYNDIAKFFRNRRKCHAH